MLHILLLILKIIGIVLLIMIGCFILLLSAVLFVPVCYEIIACKPDENGNVFFKAQIHYFLHLASAYMKYENGTFNWEARIAWKKMNENKKPRKKRVRVAKQDEVPRVKKERKQIQKMTWYEKIKTKIKHFFEKKEKIFDFFSEERHVTAFKKIKKEIGILARCISPRHIKGKIHYGLWSPYRTGQVLAFLSVLYPFYGDNVEIYPDFEQEIYEGEIHIKGHVRFVHVVRFIIRIFYDKDIKKTYRDAKKLKLVS